MCLITFLSFVCVYWLYCDVARRVCGQGKIYYTRSVNLLILVMRAAAFTMPSLKFLKGVIYTEYNYCKKLGNHYDGLL